MKVAGLIIIVLSIMLFVATMYCKNKVDFLKKLSNNHFIILNVIYAFIAFIGFFLLSFNLTVGNEHQELLRLMEMIFTTMLIPVDLYLIITSLWIRKNLIVDDTTKKTHKRLRILGIIGTFALFIMVSMYLDSITPYMHFPLNNILIPIGQGGLTYYATFIICGVALAYFIADHKIAQAGFQHGVFENLLYTAFPAGIVGARIWYVIAEWNTKFAGRDFLNVFKIWEGGLAIQGGVILGAAVGIWYMMKKHKEIPILLCIDIIIPTILIAQAVGRWGNFMNNEVYGLETARANWAFLPEWILNQLATQATQIEGTPQIVMPLFLIEGVINIAAYFLIVYGVGKGLKKFILPGDIGALYFVAYGIIRFILEPLRNKDFIMGIMEGVNKSQVMSAAFIIGGILALLAIHIIDYLKKKKEKEGEKKDA